jgi:hypothetical protein
MILKKPAPGHSHPQDGVASRAYIRPQDGVASLAYDPGMGTGFPPSRSPASAGEGRLEKITLKQKARAQLYSGHRHLERQKLLCRRLFTGGGTIQCLSSSVSCCSRISRNSI